MAGILFINHLFLAFDYSSSASLWGQEVVIWQKVWLEYETLE